MTSVCDTQDDFNTAFRNAVKYTEKKDRPKTWVLILSMSLMVLIILWALILASRVGNNQIIHYVLSLVFAPFYIIAYFLAQKRY